MADDRDLNNADPRAPYVPMRSAKPLTQIMDLIVRLAQGDFEARGHVKGDGGDFDAVIVGLNMLAEHLADAKTVGDANNDEG